MNQKLLGGGISVIIPAYNCQETIAKTIRSIIHSAEKCNFSNYEIIVVNDGSTDNTYSIVEELKKSNQILSILQQDNAGVSVARNNGLSKATKEYIMFVDSDDTILMETFNNIKDTPEDTFLIFGYIQKYKRATIVKKETKKSFLNKNQAIESLVSNNSVRGFSTNKIYRKEIIQKTNTFFDSRLRICEDLDFNIRYISKTNEKIAIIPSAYYVYYMRKNSCSKKCNSINTMQKAILEKCNLSQNHNTSFTKKIALQIRDKMLGLY